MRGIPAQGEVAPWEAAVWFTGPRCRAEPERATADAGYGRLKARRHFVTHDVGWMLSSRG